MGLKGDLAYWEAEDFGIELLDLTLGDLFDQRVAEIPDKEALVYHYPEIGLDLRLTYRQYQDEVNRLAKGLIALGIEKGDHVAAWAPNIPEWIFLELALAKIGATLVTQRGGEILGELVLAIKVGTPLQALADVINPFPAFNRVLGASLGALAAQLAPQGAARS